MNSVHVTGPIPVAAPTEPSPGPIPIDYSNKFQVYRSADNVHINVGRGLSPDEALNLAAWLLVLAQTDATHDFSEVLALVRERREST